MPVILIPLKLYERGLNPLATVIEIGAYDGINEYIMEHSTFQDMFWTHWCFWACHESLHFSLQSAIISDFMLHVNVASELGYTCITRNERKIRYGSFNK